MRHATWHLRYAGVTHKKHWGKGVQIVMDWYKPYMVNDIKIHETMIIGLSESLKLHQIELAYWHEKSL